MTATEIEQYDSIEPLRMHPELIQYARQEACAHGLLGYITVEHLKRPYTNIAVRAHDDIIFNGDPIDTTLTTFYENPTGILLEIVASPTIMRISGAQHMPLQGIPEACTFTFRCHGFTIEHNKFDLAKRKLSYEFNHRDAYIEHTVINQKDGTSIFSIGMRCNNMSNSRVRHHLAAFCLRQLRVTSHEMAHYMRHIPI